MRARYTSSQSVFTLNLTAMRRSLTKKLLVAAPPAFNFQNAPDTGEALQYVAIMVNAAVDWLVAFALLFAVIMIIISGIKFMVAGGDDEKKKNARRTLVFALVGVAVVILVA